MKSVEINYYELHSVIEVTCSWHYGVTELQYNCHEIPFEYIYDLCKWNFLYHSKNTGIAAVFINMHCMVLLICLILNMEMLPILVVPESTCMLFGSALKGSVIFKVGMCFILHMYTHYMYLYYVVYVSVYLLLGLVL